MAAPTTYGWYFPRVIALSLLDTCNNRRQSSKTWTLLSVAVAHCSLLANLVERNLGIGIRFEGS